MSDPSFVPLNLGNTADDDATVLDSLVEGVSAPPTPEIEPIVTPVLPSPKVTTKLLSVRQLVDPLWLSPTVLLPEDSRRKYLYVTVTSPADTATDGVMLRSDGGMGTALLTHGKTVPLDSHTGPLLAIAVGAAAVYVDVWSVTE